MRRLVTCTLVCALATGAATGFAGAVRAAPVIHAERGGPLSGGAAAFGEQTPPGLREAWLRFGATLGLAPRLTADDVPVLMGDPVLDRLTPCSGPLERRALAELAPCPVDVIGVSAPAERPEPLLRLDAALVSARDAGAPVSLLLAGGIDPAPVLAAVSASGFPVARLLVRSPVSAALDAARAALPGVTTALISADPGGPAAAAARGDAWLAPAWPTPASVVAAARGAGLRLAPGPLDTPADLAAGVALGLDALVTADPLGARRALGLPDPAPLSAPVAPPGPSAADVFFGGLASDGATAPRLALRWRGRGDADAAATGFDAQIRPLGFRREADWRTLVAGAARRSATFTAEPGAAYVARVRARDASGAPGAWSARGLVVPLDDGVLRGSRRAWRSEPRPAAWGGAVRVATASGATLRLSFRGRSLRLIAPTAPGAGSLDVRLDGRRSTVSLAGTTADRQVVFKSPRLRDRRHRLVVRARGAGPVAVDAVAPS